MGNVIPAWRYSCSLAQHSSTLPIRSVLALPFGAGGYVPGGRPRVFQGAPSQQSALGDFAADFQHSRENRRYEDGNLLSQGPKLKVKTLDVEDLTPVRDIAIAQKLADDVHALSQPGYRLTERQTMFRPHLHPVAGP
jgi:hypothetical protein